MAESPWRALRGRSGASSPRSSTCTKGLTLSHYDAKGHLVVARRVIDSLTPGWQQIGAVWLPLPHVLNLLPVQVDVLYRTGASGIAISIASIALLVYCATRLILASTGSRVGAVIDGAAPGDEPQPSVPAVHADDRAAARWGCLRWASRCSTTACRATTCGGAVSGSLALALACLTRYEAWPVDGRGAGRRPSLAGWRRHGSVPSGTW